MQIGRRAAIGLAAWLPMDAVDQKTGTPRKTPADLGELQGLEKLD
jgi:hypothetical protein